MALPVSVLCGAVNVRGTSDALESERPLRVAAPLARVPLAPQGPLNVTELAPGSAAVSWRPSDSTLVHVDGCCLDCTLLLLIHCGKRVERVFDTLRGSVPYCTRIWYIKNKQINIISRLIEEVFFTVLYSTVLYI